MSYHLLEYQRKSYNNEYAFRLDISLQIRFELIMEHNLDYNIQVLFSLNKQKCDYHT